MKIEIVTKNVQDDSMVREYADRKIHFALDRIKTRVERVVARLQDETGDSSVFIGRCSIEVELHPEGQIHVSAHGESIFDCVLQAVREMENAAKREVPRERNAAGNRRQQARGKPAQRSAEQGESLSTDS